MKKTKDCIIVTEERAKVLPGRLYRSVAALDNYGQLNCYASDVDLFTEEEARELIKKERQSDRENGYGTFRYAIFKKVKFLANARLIAQAPHMYHALKDILIHFDGSADWTLGKWMRMVQEAQEKFQRIDEILAKVDGKS